jgi:predicted  nucleic acid-binding Zn-ribbon protein
MSTSGKAFDFNALCNKVENMREKYHAFFTPSNFDNLTMKMQNAKNADANLDKWLEALDKSTEHKARTNLQSLIASDNFTVSRAILFVESLERKLIEKERDENRKVNSDKVGMLPEKSAKLAKLESEVVEILETIEALKGEISDLESLREKMIADAVESK